MGRKAKLKQIKKSQTNSSNHSQSNQDQFVQNMERQGYSLKDIERAPGVPQKKVEPQV